MPAAAIVGEAAVCLVLANAVLEKFGGDTLADIEAAWRQYHTRIAARLAPERD